MPQRYDETGVAVSHPGQQSQFGQQVPTPNLSPPEGKSKLVVVAVVLLIGSALGGLALAYSVSTGAKKETKKATAATVIALKRAAVAERDMNAAVARLAELEARLAKSEKSLAISEGERASAEEVVKQKQEVADELESKLKNLLSEGEGEVLKGANGRLTLKLVDKILFKSGKAELTKSGLRVMARVGKALATMDDKQVWVQGHTDNVPLKKDNALFPSNWELSAARALSVVHFLQDESKVAPARLAAAAFSSYRPVSRRRKAKNRRIEIVLFPREVKLKR